MPAHIDEVRIATVARVSAAFAAEIDRQDAAAAIPWALWPTVAAMIDHLGRNHQWVAGIVRTGEAVDRSTLSRAPTNGARQWYEQCRTEMLSALTEVPADRACWVIGGGVGTAAFWRRRMVFETTKHLIDLRAAGGGTRLAAPELTSDDYADGIDELFTVFLPRSRTSLQPLPGSLALEATDVERSWVITPEWAVHDGDPAGADAAVSASTGDLALFVWERADPMRDAARFQIFGQDAVVTAFASAAVQP